MIRLGSLAAFAQVLAYLLFLLLVLVILPAQAGIQVADFLDPASLLAKAAGHSQAVPTLVSVELLDIGFGIFPLFIMVALMQQLQTAASERYLLLAFITINTALWLAAAAIDTGGLPAFVQLYQQHPDEARTGYRVLETVTLQLTNAAAAAYGVSILIVSRSAWRMKALARSFLWLSLIWGAIAILSWPFIVIGALGPIVGIIWSLWTGVILWRAASTLPKQAPVPAAGERTS